MEEYDLGDRRRRKSSPTAHLRDAERNNDDYHYDDHEANQNPHITTFYTNLPTHDYGTGVDAHITKPRAAQRPRDGGPSTLEKVIGGLVQVIGVTAALVFGAFSGAFSIVSWRNSETAKLQADTANAIALLAHCSEVRQQADSSNDTLLPLCNQIQAEATKVLGAVATTLFGLNPAPGGGNGGNGGNSPSTPPDEGKGLTTGERIGLVIMALSVCFAAITAFMKFSPLSCWRAR